jgi:hypothetical protein
MEPSKEIERRGFGLIGQLTVACCTDYGAQEEAKTGGRDSYWQFFCWQSHWKLPFLIQTNLLVPWLLEKKNLKAGWHCIVRFVSFMMDRTTAGEQSEEA